MTPSKAKEVFFKYNTKPNLLKHSVAVAATMKHFAHLAGEDETFWEVVGILHDVDYEQYPDEHCHKLVDILKAEGLDDKTIRAIQSHGYEICTDVEPVLYMEKVLCAVDQLTGFIIACALIRPERKLDLVTLESAKKKWARKEFAAGTDRDRIMRFCERLGVDFDYMFMETFTALKGVAGELGL